MVNDVEECQVFRMASPTSCDSPETDTTLVSSKGGNDNEHDVCTKWALPRASFWFTVTKRLPVLYRGWQDQLKAKLFTQRTQVVDMKKSIVRKCKHYFIICSQTDLVLISTSGTLSLGIFQVSRFLG